MIKIKIFIVTLLIANSFSLVRAENWPNWRGPNGDGTSSETNLPTEWDSIKNVAWKSPVPGTGLSSPIVWENRLFMTTAKAETQEKILLCYDCETGQLIWQRTVVRSTFEKKHNHNTYASGTPVTDGTLIFVSFLDVEDVLVAAYDFSGTQVWLKRIGKYSSPHGYSISPALFEDKVIINGSSKEEPFTAALNKSDGKIIWKNKHENPAHSFSTPIFREIAGKMQMILGGDMQIASYNPYDGSKYWFVNGPSSDFCATPVYNEKSGLIIISSAWRERILIAIKPDGAGNVTESHVAWQQREGGHYVPSPVCTDDYIFPTMTNGTVHCIDIATGNSLWSEKLGKQYASPVLVNGLVYMPNDEGVIRIIKPGPTLETISVNRIGERMQASPALSNGKIYLRGDKHLFCIGE